MSARDDLKAYQAANPEVSMTDVSRAIGMSTAAISQWMRGEYKGDNEAIDNKIYGLLALMKERQETPGLEIPFVATSVTKAVFEICKLCHLDNEIGVIYGDSGLGKTKAVREYTRRHKDVVLVEVDLGFSARTLFAEICRALGLSGIGHLHGLFEDAVARLRRSGRLLIIDEAEQLPYRALELTRRLYDKAGIGIILIGMPRLVENLRGRKQEYKQLYSRVGVAAQLSNLSKDDVTSLINSAMPAANGLTAAFYEESRNNARHLRMLLRRSDRLAKINKTKITREIIKKAAETLFI